MVSRGDIYLVALDPTRGHGKKTRPAVILSPDEMNRGLQTAVIAPMTTKSHAFPTRVPLTFQGKRGFVVLDQIRAIDHARLVKKIGAVQASTMTRALAVLQEMFAD